MNTSNIPLRNHLPPATQIRRPDFNRRIFMFCWIIILICVNWPGICGRVWVGVLEDRASGVCVVAPVPRPDDVVLRAAVEVRQPQLRFHPVDPVLRCCEAPVVVKFTICSKNDPSVFVQNATFLCIMLRQGPEFIRNKTNTSFLCIILLHHL